jgi:hypothetical protein
MGIHRLGTALAVTLAFVPIACSSTPAVTGEWLLGSRDSVDFTVELLRTGEARLHEYYFGHDSAKREAVRREDSLAQVRARDKRPGWFIRRDSLCVLGVGALGSYGDQCAAYQIHNDGDLPVLQVEGERWLRYHAR